MQDKNALNKFVRPVLFLVVLLSVVALQSCDKEEPKRVHEEEVITNVKVVLTPAGGGDVVALAFSDADGPLGDIEPTITASGPLRASAVYAAVIELTNETVTPAVNVSEEIAGEASEHLFCFDVTGDIVITYEDEDENQLPLGLATSWVTGAPGVAEVTVILRHQPEAKTGQCPGTGETDIEITFTVRVE